MDKAFFSAYFLPATLVLIMGGMGLSLSLQNFRNVLRYPKAVLVGLVAQMVVLPLLAFVLAKVFGLAPAYATGLMIVASCPGGASAGLISHLLKANVALSMCLTTFNSLLCVATIPWLVDLSLAHFMGQSTQISLPFGETVVDIALLTLLPTGVGLWIRSRYPAFAKAADRPLRYLMPLMLVVAFGGVAGAEHRETESLVSMVRDLLPPTLLLNGLGMLLGLLLALAFRLGPMSRITIPLEVGLQNVSLAIFVSQVMLNNNAMALVAVVYSSFSFGTAVLFGYTLRETTRRVRRFLYHKRLASLGRSLKSFQGKDPQAP
ncbi:MAG: bile acid:sodium symporter family protein [Bacteroidota bacterium]